MSFGQRAGPFVSEMALKSVSKVHSSAVYSYCNRDVATLPTSNRIIKTPPQATHVWCLFFDYCRIKGGSSAAGVKESILKALTLTEHAGKWRFYVSNDISQLR